MSNETTLIPSSTPTTTPVVELPVNTDKKVINIDELNPNSVVVIKISAEGMQQRMAATQQIAMALRPLRDLIQTKNIAFIVMGTNEAFEVLDEEQMNQIGWYKKEESLIVVP